MGKKLILENEFAGAPGGNSGTMNYSVSYGTPNSQANLSHFTSDKPNHLNDSGSSAFVPSSSNPQIDPRKNIDPQIDSIFKKKNTPSPDEIISGMKYELNQMTQKDKNLAKQTVLKNLRTDPQYYSRLGMLNINDEDMHVDENQFLSKFSKTKNVLDEMVNENRKNVLSNKTLDDIFKDMWNKRHGYEK